MEYLFGTMLTGIIRRGRDGSAGLRAKPMALVPLVGKKGR